MRRDNLVSLIEGDDFNCLLKFLCAEEKVALSRVSRACKRRVEASVHKLKISLDQDSDETPSRFPAVELLRICGDNLEVRLAWQGLQIRALQVRDRQVLRQQLQDLSILSGLQSVDLQHCVLRDIQPLSALHNLTELNLNHVESVKRVTGLYSLTTLRAIHVGHSDADRQFVHDLSMQFQVLQLLDVAYSRDITHTGSRDTFRRFGGLTCLIFDGYADMRDLEPLRHLSAFKHFSIQDCGVQDAWLQSLSHLIGLTRLCIADNPDLTDAGLRWISAVTTLVELDIRFLPEVTVPGVSTLGALASLRRLQADDRVVGSDQNPRLAGLLALDAVPSIFD